MTTPPRHKVRSEFLVLMYFAHLLPAERLLEVLDERVRDIASMLEYIDAFEREGHPTPGVELVAGLGRAALKAQLDVIRDYRRRWLAERRDEPVLSRAV